MTRAEVRQFIEAGIDKLQRDIPFGFGRLTGFNSRLNKEMPYAWLESLNVSGDPPAHGGATIEAWAVALHIADQDKPDNLEEDSERLIDACDLLAQKLSQVYDKILEPSVWVVSSGARRTPFTKRHADCLSGVIFSFTLSAPQRRGFCVDFADNCCDNG